jgi:hypothetical protein
MTDEVTKVSAQGQAANTVLTDFRPLVTRSALGRMTTEKLSLLYKRPVARSAKVARLPLAFRIRHYEGGAA